MEESNNARKVSFSDDRSAKRQKSSEIDDQVGAAAVTEANGTIVDEAHEAKHRSDDFRDAHVWSIRCT